MAPPIPTYELLVVRQTNDAPANTTVTATPIPTPKPEHHSGGLSGWAIFVIIVVVFGAIAVAAIFLMQRRRRTHGFGSGGGPAAAGGPLGIAKSWLSRATYKLRNPRARSASAGFEGISAGRAAGLGGSSSVPRNRSALDPDEAWDSRVGNEAEYGGYYEETELQQQHLPHHTLDDGRYESLQHGTTAYTGAGGPAAGAGRGAMPAENPFSDDHVMPSNLRSVSPRPVEDGHDAGHAHASGQHSPTRKSLFKESV